MDAEELISHYPRLFHMAEPDAWPLIRKYGLLSTRALLEVFEVSAEPRQAILGAIRPEMVPIQSPLGETARIRDQTPLKRSALEACLTDMSVEEWTRLLNEHVFFWVREERLLGLLAARAYRGRSHTVLTLKTAELVQRQLEQIRLTALNTGSTIDAPRPRGSKTFKRVDDFDFAARRRAAGANAVVELAVLDGVRELDSELIESVRTFQGSVQTGTLFP